MASMKIFGITLHGLQGPEELPTAYIWTVRLCYEYLTSLTAVFMEYDPTLNDNID
jgi:hypothetical protein